MAIERSGLLSRSEIARLAGVERPAVTNWERRYDDFPKPMMTSDGSLFRREEVIAWLSSRPIPARGLRADERPGATYGDRLSVGEPMNQRRSSTPSGSGGSHPAYRLAAVLADAPQAALRGAGYWHIVLGLAFMRRFRLEAWQELAARLEPSGLRQMLSRGFAAAGLTEAARTAAGLPNTPAVWHSLAAVVDLLNGVAVSPADAPAEGDDLTYLFDHAFDRLAGESRYAFVTPRSIARLIAELVGPVTGGEWCVDLFCRAGELLVEVLRQAEVVAPEPLRIDGAHPSSVMTELARMNVAMHGPGTISVGTIGEEISLSAYGSVDVVVTNPPFGSAAVTEAGPGRYGPSRRKEMILLQQAVELLGEKGRGAIVMPNVAAFGGGAADRAVRQALVEQGAVAAVVALPPNLFAETAIGVMLWLVQRPTGEPDDVLFIDAQALGTMVSRTRRELRPDDIETVVYEFRRWQAACRTGARFEHTPAFSRSVAPGVIDAHDYSLSPSVYVQPESVEMRSVSDEELGSLRQELVGLTERAREVDAQVSQLIDRLNKG